MMGAIFYSDNRLEGTKIFEECLKTVKACPLPIVSCSLKPLDLGTNIVLKGRVRSYPTMALQILMALEASTAKYVFFLEHDILYSPTHFDFTPPTDDMYYYNVNNYRWEFPKDRAITYGGLTSLSALCCNRELAIRHYKYRLHLIDKWGLEKDRSKEPRWARRFGYEPGTKKKRRGGVTDEDCVKFRSALPNVDIRHPGTFSRPKIRLDEFKHPPDDFKEVTVKEIPYWGDKLFAMFNL